MTRVTNVQRYRSTPLLTDYNDGGRWLKKHKILESIYGVLGWLNSILKVFCGSDPSGCYQRGSEQLTVTYSRWYHLRWITVMTVIWSEPPQVTPREVGFEKYLQNWIRRSKKPIYRLLAPLFLSTSPTPQVWSHQKKASI